jgi:hypothetical protein
MRSRVCLRLLTCGPPAHVTAGKANCEWRHSCVLALAAAAQSLDDLPPLHPDLIHRGTLMAEFGRISAAVRAGPFGSVPTEGAAVHIVATDTR